MAMFRQPGDDLAGPLPEALRRQLPGTILAHGWWLMGEDKMSKSKGNVVRPDDLLRFGNDAVRFFFMREMQVGLDRGFSFEGFMDRLNADLANGLGNLASRTLSMLQRYRGGRVPEAQVLDDQDREVLEAGRAVLPAYLAKAAANDFHAGLELLWTYLRQLDGYIVKSEPWKLAKDPSAAARLDTVLCQLYRALRATAVLTAPVMPEIAQKLWEGLGMAGAVADQRFERLVFDAPAPGPVAEPAPLFQRIDKEAIMQEAETAADPAAQAAVAEQAIDLPPVKDQVDYDTFARTDLRVGLVRTAERVPKSKKLIKMTVDLGFETRTILGGIGTAYEPEQLVGRKVVVVANLAPRPLMGIMSHGMLLAASDNDSKPYLVAPPEDAKPGFVVR
jgi:methionyl-tRNA synthetase